MGIVERIDEVEIFPDGVICDGMLDIYLNSRHLRGAERERLILNDGFDSEEDFKSFFKKPFKGVLITWENVRLTQKGGEG